MQQYIIEKLKRVSFDRSLFLREFQKSKRWLKKEELDEVEKWAKCHHQDKFDHSDFHFNDEFETLSKQDKTD